MMHRTAGLALSTRGYRWLNRLEDWRGQELPSRSTFTGDSSAEPILNTVIPAKSAVWITSLKITKAAPRPENMLAARYSQGGKNVTIDEIPTPTIGKNEVLVKVGGIGVCHSDLHMINGIIPPRNCRLPAVTKVRVLSTKLARESRA